MNTKIKNNPLPILFLLFVTFTFFSANSFAETTTITNPLDPSILSGQDVYKLIEGKFKGSLLFTNKGFKEVPLDLNLNTSANGHIGTPEELFTNPITMETSGCAGEHFHGIIGNEDDPSSHGCGWGKVKQLKTEIAIALETLNTDLVLIKQSEADILSKLSTLGALSIGGINLQDIDNLLVELEVQTTKLAGLLTTLKSSSANNSENSLSKKSTQLIIRQIQCALLSDKMASSSLNGLKKFLSKEDINVNAFFAKKDSIIKKLERANECKDKAKELTNKL